MRPSETLPDSKLRTASVEASGSGWLAAIHPEKGIVYRTRLGSVVPTVLAIGPGGRVLVGGTVTSAVSILSSSDVPGLQKLYQGGSSDGFLLVADPSATGARSLVASTYWGGGQGSIGFDHDAVGALAFHPNGDVLVTGYAGGSFPAQGKRGGGKDAFVARLAGDLSRVRSSFTFGGQRNEFPVAVATAADGSTWVAGVTESDDFPRVHAIPELDSGPHLFVTRVNSVGTAIIDSTWAGRASPGLRPSLATGPAGQVYIGATSRSLAAHLHSVHGAVETMSQIALLRLEKCASCPPPPAIRTATRDGDTVTVEGRGFHSGAKVLLGTQPAAAAQITGGSRIEVRDVPDDVAEISVVNPDGQSATFALAVATAQQNRLPWVLIGAGVGALILIAAIAFFLVRRLRKPKRRPISSSYRPASTSPGTTPRPVSPATARAVPPPAPTRPAAPPRTAAPAPIPVRRPPRRPVASRSSGSWKKYLLIGLALVVVALLAMQWRAIRRTFTAKEPRRSVYLEGTGVTVKMQCQAQEQRVLSTVQTSQGTIPAKSWRCASVHAIESASVADYPMEPVYAGTFNRELAMQDAVDATLRELKARMISTRPAAYNREPGREILAEVDDPTLGRAVAKIRVFVLAWRVVTIYRIVPKGAEDDEEMRTFFHRARNHLVEEPMR